MVFHNDNLKEKKNNHKANFLLQFDSGLAFSISLTFDSLATISMKLICTNVFWLIYLQLDLFSWAESSHQDL